jgi:hypothetical protein
MIKTLCTSEAAEELFRDENANWTRLGAYALVEYFEQLEEDCGTPIEFDRVAIRCDYSQYSSPQEAAEDHGWKPDSHVADDGQECDADALQWLQDRTSVIEFEGGIIVAQF